MTTLISQRRFGNINIRYLQIHFMRAHSVECTVLLLLRDAPSNITGHHIPTIRPAIHLIEA